MRISAFSYRALRNGWQNGLVPRGAAVPVGYNGWRGAGGGDEARDASSRRRGRSRDSQADGARVRTQRPGRPVRLRRCLRARGSGAIRALRDSARHHAARYRRRVRAKAAQAARRAGCRTHAHGQGRRPRQGAQPQTGGRRLHDQALQHRGASGEDGRAAQADRGRGGLEGGRPRGRRGEQGGKAGRAGDRA